MEFVSSCHSTVFSPEPIRYIKLNWSLFHSVSRSGNVKMWQSMELILSQSIKMSSNLESPSRCSYVSPCLTNFSHDDDREQSQVEFIWRRKSSMIKWLSATRHSTHRLTLLVNFTNNWLHVNRAMSTHFFLIYWLLTRHRPLCPTNQRNFIKICQFSFSSSPSPPPTASQPRKCANNKSDDKIKINSRASAAALR